jgi:hypothetical protein
MNEFAELLVCWPLIKGSMDTNRNHHGIMVTCNTIGECKKKGKTRLVYKERKKVFHESYTTS